MEHTLSGKVVIITGASSGIGRATARALSGLGCRLTLAARSAEKLRALTEELGPETLAVTTDVTVGAQVTQMVAQTMERFGRVDVLFANAGIYFPGQVAEQDPDDWAKLLDTNVDGVLRSVHAVLPHMTAQQSGDILITTSISGNIDLHNEPIYSASKHAVQAFTHTLRRQVAPHGIRVGSVAPGVVANEIWGVTDPVKIDEYVQKRTGIRSEDVAETVIFMLSRPPHVTIRDVVILPQNQDI